MNSIPATANKLFTIKAKGQSMNPAVMSIGDAPDLLGVLAGDVPANELTPGIGSEKALAIGMKDDALYPAMMPGDRGKFGERIGTRIPATNRSFKAPSGQQLAVRAEADRAELLLRIQYFDWFELVFRLCRFGISGCHCDSLTIEMGG